MKSKKQSIAGLCALALLASLSFLLLEGCYGTHFHNRSVVHYTTQDAATYGTITNNPAESGTQSVDAAKSADIDAAVSTASGAAKNTPDADAQPAETEVKAK